MAHKVLVFFPKDPYPPVSGDQQRLFQMLMGLKGLGCQVMLAGLNLKGSKSWVNEKTNAIKQHIDDAVFYEIGVFDRMYSRSLRVTRASAVNTIHRYSQHSTSPMIRRWFRGLVRKWKPDSILINYVSWHELLDESLNSLSKVLETHQILSLKNKYRDKFEPIFPRKAMEAKEIPPEWLEEDCVGRLGFAPDPEEFKLFDKFDHTVSISPKDDELVRKSCKKTRPVYIPHMIDAVYLDNSYRAEPIFPSGTHPFAVQGYYYFVKRVLPLVLDKQPDFRLALSGNACKFLLPVHGIEMQGFVPDLKPLYASSSFMVGPILGGTGQPTKIIEGMAHGLAIVTNQYAAELTPIQHGHNGFVARGPEEFADYVLRLCQDQAMCQQMGEAARETIRTEYSREHLLGALKSIL